MLMGENLDKILNMGEIHVIYEQIGMLIPKHSYRIDKF